MKVNKTRNGEMMFMENDLQIGRSLSKYGEANYFKTEFLKKLLSEKDVVVDVGANIGSVTIPLAKAVPEGYVLALEPHTFSYFMLCGNIALNQLTNVQAFNRAAGENSKSLCYFPSVDVNSEVDMSQIKLATILNAKDSEGRKCENPISAIGIDDLGLSKPKLIKISVQGMEVATLRGGRVTIDRATPSLYVCFKENKEDILKFLATIGYDWELHETPVYNSNNYLYNKVNELGDDVSENLFCYPKGGRPDVEDEYLVDLDKSEDPKHKKIKELRDSLTDAEFKTI